MKSTALSLYHILHCNTDCNCQLRPSLFTFTITSVTFSSGCSCNTERHRQAVINDLCGTSLTPCLCVGDRGAAAGQHRWWHHSVVLFWNRGPPIHPSVGCRELHVKVPTLNPNVATWFYSGSRNRVVKRAFPFLEWQLRSGLTTEQGPFVEVCAVHSCHFSMLHIWGLCVQGRVSPASLWLGSVSPWSWNRCECAAIPAQGLAGVPEQTDPKHHAGARGQHLQVRRWAHSKNGTKYNKQICPAGQICTEMLCTAYLIMKASSL